MRRVIILLMVIAGLLVVYFSFWYRYKQAMDKANRDWYEKEYIGKGIKGVLTSISEVNDNPLRVVLGIQNDQEDYEITYGLICVDKDFKDFVQVGDSVFKIKGEKIVRFCTSEDTCGSFELIFCDRFN